MQSPVEWQFIKYPIFLKLSISQTAYRNFQATVEEYHELIKEDAAKMTYYEDTEMVVSNIQEAIKNHTVTEFADFRKQHRDGHIVWVHVQAKQIERTAVR